MEISIKWNICRVCLQEESKNDKGTAEGKMMNIFGGDNDKLVNYIYDCSGVQVSILIGKCNVTCLRRV